MKSYFIPTELIFPILKENKISFCRVEKVISEALLPEELANSLMEKYPSQISVSNKNK